MLPVAVAWSFSDSSAMLCTSGFVNGGIFSYNGANGPESKMMNMFRPVWRHESDIRQHCLVKFAPVAALRAKSAFSDCIMQL